MIIVLRASAEAEDLDLDACQEWLPGELLQRAWRSGQPRINRSVETTTGFTLALAEDDTGLAMVRAAAELARIAPQLKKLTQAGVIVELDIGLEVGGELPKSVTLTSELLQLVVEVQALVSVTAYPCSDVD